MIPHQPPVVIPEETTEDIEWTNVLSWRALMLRALGVDPALAEMAVVSAPELDWHEVQRLVGAGCPPFIALEIVL